ncbi:PIR Superfamily Protein [Plasmodium ovale wallikeri]|uniref:PIR Superfamily Protein n=1 Tax=Plasmodium ovale wallikeri TaxID=864142 RepID=A0A1A9AN76_PLAOA|nr:PIR Superfamily Protein [Plasmodium ovale wallikeri]
MDNLEEPECFDEITDENLPSSIFDDDFTKSIELESLEDALFQNKQQDFVDTWSKKFTKTFLYYYNEKSKGWPKDIHNKRCRDFNYFADYITDLILQIGSKGEKGKKIDIPKEHIDSMKENLKLLFTKSDGFNCVRVENEYTTQLYIRKRLDDFCENKNHLIKCLNKNKGQCKNITKFINDKYKIFFNDKSCITDPNPMEKKFFNINEKCTFYDIPTTFSCKECNDYNVPNDIYTIPHCPRGNVSIFDDVDEYEHQYVDRTSSVEKIIEYVVYTCFTLLGITLFFLIIRKIIPLGNFLCNKIIKHKKIKNMNPYISEMPENLSYYEIQQTENFKYSIPYDQIKNNR